MNKKIKTFINEEYKTIYDNLNVNWQKGFKNKLSELYSEGIINSGMSQIILTNYAIELVKDINVKIKKLLIESQEKFNFEMSCKDIEDYINKSIDNSNDYLQKMQNDLLDYFDKKKMPLVEDCKMQLRNAKLNNKVDLNKIKNELILIKKGKNKEKRKTIIKFIVEKILKFKK